MGYIRFIVCDVCKKKENLDEPYRKKWFIENIIHAVCSKKCFEKNRK